MPLESGQSLSFYEIIDSLGAGAMGEVYRAKDTRLDREVAIKVLPEHFAGDDERLQRFEREAKSLASLNHPNVAQIHGVDQVGDTWFLVLELVPGETLEERIAHGPLPVEEAVDVCRQIAEGLEAAHEAGVIHRDLKPANVRITPDGKVKVLDFGLAKPTGPYAETESEVDSVLTTEAGRLLGTPTYMAPEQARGKPIDKRVDVWAFGCVFFECLTAERAFAGETLPDILAAVLQDEPSWHRLPFGTPTHVGELISRCVQKDPRQRLRDMGDAWLELTRAHDAEPAQLRADTTTTRGPRSAIAGVALALAGGALLGFALRSAPPSQRPRVTHTALPQSPDRLWSKNRSSSSFAISRDGETVVYCAEVDNGARGTAQALVLWDRSVPEPKTLWVAGPELELGNPLFSEDGAWVVFQVIQVGSYELRRVSALGGKAQTLCSLPTRVVGATWGPDGDLLFGTALGGICRVSEQGVIEQVTSPEPGVEWMHKFPDLLPGAEELLYVVDYEGPKNDVVLRSLTTGHQEILIPGATWVRYLEPGYLIYTMWEDLWADSFDPVTHRLGGRPVQLSERVVKSIHSYIDVARDGTLIYASPVTVRPKRSIHWVQRDGSVEESGLPTGANYEHVALSPKGTRAVFGFGSPLRGGEIVVADLSRKTLEPPLVSEVASNPIWSANGEEILWYGGGAGGFLFRRSASGVGVTERGGLFETPAMSILEDGRVLHAQYSLTEETGKDIFLTPFDANALTDRVPLLAGGGDQVHASLSPDLEWLAYMNFHRALGAQVFVTFNPPAGPGIQVSFEGGAYPRWSRDGDELFFANKGKLMVAAATKNADGIEFGEPTLIYDGLTTTTEWPGQPFDVTPDGQRFLVIVDDPSSPVERPEIRLVTNLLEEVRAKMEERE